MARAKAKIAAGVQEPPADAPEKPIPVHGVFHQEATATHPERWEAYLPPLLPLGLDEERYLGSFKTFEQAARTHDRAAIKIHKHDAKLNYPLWEYQRERQHLDSISVEELLSELRGESDFTEES